MIQVKHLDKFYKKHQVLFDFSIDIHNEEHNIYGLVGPNGSGKTTFFKVLTGLLDYSQGSIVVDSVDDYFSWCRENVILIPTGEKGMKYRNSVYDNVMYFAALKGADEKRTRALLEEYSDCMHYGDFMKRRINTLSTGQKKKAMLLCGLCSDMSVIIMDEPSNGLDIDAQLEMKELLKKLAIERNKTVIVSSHDMVFLSGLADNYTFIFKGKKINEIKGTMNAEEIIEKYEMAKKQYGEKNEIIF